jgi:8-oxo-dGTP pyrophosphatase MutT (NUDIX family)
MILHKNPFFSVQVYDDLFTIRFSSEQVIVLAVVDDSHIVFIQSIRPVFNCSLMELPAGAVDSEEKVEDAALREFLEETGIAIEDVNRLISLPALNVLPNRTNQMLNVFQLGITRKEYEDRIHHDSEVEGVFLLSFQEVITKINQGEFFISPFVAVCLTYIVNSMNRIS